MYVFNDTPTHVYKHPNCYELQEAGNDQRRQRGIEEQQRRWSIITDNNHQYAAAIDLCLQVQSSLTQVSRIFITV